MSSDCDKSFDGQWQTKCLDNLWPIWGEGFFYRKFLFWICLNGYVQGCRLFIILENAPPNF